MVTCTEIPSPTEETRNGIILVLSSKQGISIIRAVISEILKIELVTDPASGNIKASFQIQGTVNNV